MVGADDMACADGEEDGDGVKEIRFSKREMECTTRTPKEIAIREYGFKEVNYIETVKSDCSLEYIVRFRE